MLGECFEKVKKGTALVHCITNYVTVNDVANIIIACGGSPIMSDEPKDAKEITGICNGLYINIGTLNERSVRAMFTAGKKANEKGNIVLLDPVGTGASSYRTETAAEIIKKIKVDIIRGNISEIKALALGSGSTKGVDADVADAVTEENLEEMIEFVKSYSKETNSVIAVTGAIDLVADEKKCYIIRNGHRKMSEITGTGCMLSGIAATYAAVNRGKLTEAVASAVCLMGLAGENGAKNMISGEGNATLRNRIIDEVYNMNKDAFCKGARYEVR